MTEREAKAFLNNLKVCIEEHPIVADWLVEVADRKTEPTISKMEQVDEPITQTKTQNSNLTFEKDECAKEYEELGLKELKELIKADRKTEPQTMLNDGTLVINVEDATKVGRVLVGDDKNRGDLYYPDDEDEPQTDCAWR